LAVGKKRSWQLAKKTVGKKTVGKKTVSKKNSWQKLRHKEKNCQLHIANCQPKVCDIIKLTLKELIIKFL
jgi:hypothetical protein